MTATLAPSTDLEVREAVQRRVARSLGRRRVASGLYLGVVGLCLGLAFLPLFSILDKTIVIGGHYIRLSFFTQNPLSPTVTDENQVGGIQNALVGTLLIVAVAIVLSVPLGVVGGIGLFEFDNRFIRFLRNTLFSVLAMPSILCGIFVLIIAAIFKLPYGGYLGASALSILMVPLVATVTYEGLSAVPRPHVEAAYALGARRFGLMRMVMLPEARTRILPGVMLAISRAIGETAPVLFVIGANGFTTWDPFSQTASLPTLIWNDLSSEFPTVVDECWAIALVAIVIVLILNLSARTYYARQTRSRVG